MCTLCGHEQGQLPHILGDKNIYELESNLIIRIAPIHFPWSVVAEGARGFTRAPRKPPARHQSLASAQANYAL